MSTTSESSDEARADAPTITCDDTARLIAAFAHGGLKRDGIQLMRGHLEGCDECRRSYRSSLEAVGRLGKSLRESKEPSDERETPTERNKRIVSRAHASQTSRRRPFALRAMMVTAGMIFLFSAIAKMMDHPDAATVFWVKGEVGIGDAVLGAETDGEILIEAGWCWTGADSKARVELDGTEIEMGSKSQLLLEDRRDLSFHLQSGSLIVDGPAEVLTSRGLVRVLDGIVTIHLKSGRLELESSGGHLECVTALGTRSLAPGDPALIVD